MRQFGEDTQYSWCLGKKEAPELDTSDKSYEYCI